MGTEILAALPAEVDTAIAGSTVQLAVVVDAGVVCGRAPAARGEAQSGSLPCRGSCQYGAESCRTAPPFSNSLVRKLSALSRLRAYADCSLATAARGARRAQRERRPLPMVNQARSASRGSAPACSAASSGGGVGRASRQRESRAWSETRTEHLKPRRRHLTTRIAGRAAVRRLENCCSSACIAPGWRRLAYNSESFRPNLMVHSTLLYPTPT